MITAAIFLAPVIDC